MSTDNTSRLPDPVYGSANANHDDHHRLRVSSSSTGGGALLHAHIGGVYVAMSERNWRQLFNQLSQLDIVAPPAVTHSIRFNDADRTATIDTEVTA